MGCKMTNMASFTTTTDTTSDNSFIMLSLKVQNVRTLVENKKHLLKSEPSHWSPHFPGVISSQSGLLTA